MPLSIARPPLLPSKGYRLIPFTLCYLTHLDTQHETHSELIMAGYVFIELGNCVGLAGN